MGMIKELVALVNDADENRREKNYEAATQKLGRAAEFAKQLNRPRLLAIIFMRMGQAFEADNKTQHALAAHEASFKSLTFIDALDLDDVFQSMFRVAVGKSYTYVPLSESVNISPDLYTPQTESDLFKAADDPHLVPKTLINIGNAYLRMKQSNPAADRFKQALERPEIDKVPELQGMALTHLGLIRVREDKLDEAADHLEKALAAFEQAGSSAADQRRAQTVLASLRFKQDKTAEALDLYNKAERLYAATKDTLGQQRTQINIGHIHLLEKDWDKALSAFQQAKGLKAETVDKQALGYLFWGMGRCFMASDKTEEAIDAFNQSLTYVENIHDQLASDEGKVAFFDSVQEIYDGLIEAWLTRVDQVDQNGDAYAALLEIIDRSRGLSFQDLLESRRSVKRKVTTQRPPERSIRPFEQIAQTASHVDLDLDIDFNPNVRFASNIGSENIPLRPPSRDLDVDFDPDVKIASNIGGTDIGLPLRPVEPAPEVERRPPPPPRPMARLVYYGLPEQLIILGVSVDGDILGHVAPLGDDALAERVKNLLQALDADVPPNVDANRFMGRRPPAENNGGDPAETQLKTLYQTLVQPVAAHFPTDGTPIIVEPHGALWLLPFAALLAPDGTSFIDQAPLLSVPAYPILKEIREEPDYGVPEELKALLVGNPAYPRFIEFGGSSYQMEPLPAAAKEAKQIGKQLKPSRQTLLKPAEATASKVEDLLNEHQIIHLATHGIAYANDPNASFLAFAKGKDDRPILTVRDVMRQSIQADLVVLSACQTGLGRISGDGMLGLGRAFLAVGARTVIVSLWNVSDSATAELMTHFYRFYLELDDKAIALQQAMIQLRKNPTFAKPKFWAPFVLIGAEM